MVSIDLQVKEIDEAGNLTATYIESANAEERKRIDVVLPAATKSSWQHVLDIFLPAGYPQSVTDDYLAYQIYLQPDLIPKAPKDSLQAFSSSIAGLLASRAVLEGVGVGDATASPTAALLLSVVQESMGRIATILFAWKLGTALEPECKMYRLQADIFNDAAMILDCLSPAFPKVARVFILSCSSVLRALCGVAAGSAKASLSAHFAKWGNLGELNAKDSSQETVISLMGMLVGTFVVSRISTGFATWTALILLLAVHLGTNHAAVRAVSMDTLNRQRANLVFSHILDERAILTPKQVSARERIFERDGVLRWKGDQIIGYCQIGVRLQILIDERRRSLANIDMIGKGKPTLASVLQIFRKHSYMLWIDPARGMATIVLKRGATTATQLQAWMHALILAQHFHERQRKAMSYEEIIAAITKFLPNAVEAFDSHKGSLKEAGWNTDVAALETRSGSRISYVESARNEPA